MNIVKISDKAEKIIVKLKSNKEYHSNYVDIKNLLYWIKLMWLDIKSNKKNIWSWIYRFRVGRRRILITKELKDMFKVWIIEQEKDTKKDYDRWKNYIIKTRKN